MNIFSQSRVPVCHQCGSENVAADAAARWSMEYQEWQVCTVFDKGHGCDDRGAEDIELTWHATERAKDIASNHALSGRESATILAALRYWQREGLGSVGSEHDIADDHGRFKPLSVADIDQLCERINLCDRDKKSR